jgi:translation initiation factor IF-2
MIEEKNKQKKLTRLPKPAAQAAGGQVSRPPVVVVMGHVDSGKTSILDNIRKSHVAEKETGGITQHVGAYEVEFPISSGRQGETCKKITFLDTPGHEAFSQMRSRGAKVADIAVLVVDGCEGVKAQTKEAISHMKKAEVPLIIAINKCDKPDSDPEKAKRELSKENILVESFGGKIPSVNVSAKTGKGIPDLLELILIVAEMENLTGDISKSAEGVIIESYADNHRGPTATLILREGLLRVGDIIGTSSTFGKIKILEDFQEKSIETVYPSMPAIVIGFKDTPLVGEKFVFFSDIETAENSVVKKSEISKEVFFFEPGQKVLNLILKADVLGSIEAISEVLKNLPQEKVILRILESRVGDVNESDIKLARSAKAKILGFRVRTSSTIKNLAQREKVKIINFDIIYELVEEIRKHMERILEPETVREDLGRMKALVLFFAEKNRQIIGGKVIEGSFKKGVSIEIFRGEERVGKGRLISLQKNKKDVEKVIKGEECGILYEGDAKIQLGDILVMYQESRTKCGLE